ncbi:MAG: GAF domain-containing protein [bacterium]|nr:GAF domain-containing protein [bacterium]
MDDARRKVEEAVAAEKPLKEVLAIVIEEGRRLSGADSCSVIMLDRGTRELVFFVIGGKRGKGGIEEVRFPAKKGITGAVIKSGKSQYVNDPSKDRRFYSKIEKMSGLHTENIMVTPLRFKDKTIGALDVLNKPGGFDEQDLLELEAFSRFAGEALGKSKKLADEIKSGEFLATKFEATMDHLFMYKR